MPKASYQVSIIGWAAIFVELTALVVKAVGHLMAYDSSYSTIVAYIIGLGVEKRGL